MSLEEETVCENYASNKSKDFVGGNRTGWNKLKRKTVLSTAKCNYLEAFYEKDMYPRKPMIERLAAKLKLSHKKVYTWFCNRRKKHRVEAWPESLSPERQTADARDGKYSSSDYASQSNVDHLYTSPQYQHTTTHSNSQHPYTSPQYQHTTTHSNSQHPYTSPQYQENTAHSNRV